MLDKNNIPFVPTNKNNSAISKSEQTIHNLSKQFTNLQQENRHLVTKNANHTGLIGKFFPTKEEKLLEKQTLEKLSALHRHEMEIGFAICEAKKQEIQMQIAAALSQRQVILDTQTKERISEIYQNFGRVMNDRISEAVEIYLEVLRQAEAVTNTRAKQQLLNYAERKFEQDCKFIEDLANNVLQNIYADL